MCIIKGMFEYSISKEKTLKLQDENAVVKTITGFWEDFDKGRQNHKTMMSLLKKELYLSNEAQISFLAEQQKSKSSNEDNWQSNINLNKPYALAETYKAYVYETLHKDSDQLFDVEGEGDNQSQSEDIELKNAANIQKKFILSNLDDMDASAEFKKAVEISMYSGAMQFMTGWTEKFRDIKRRSEDIPKIQAEVDKKFKPEVVFDEYGMPQEKSKLQILKNNGVTATLRVPVYIGATIKAIDPNLFVFDPNNWQNWDSCHKIYKPYVHIQDVLDNEFYKLSDDAKAELKNKLESTSDNDKKDDEARIRESYIGNQVEIMQYFGDLTVEGVTLRNWSAVILARKYLILFEENSFVINPFIYECTLRDPDTGCGIPNMLSILSISYLENKNLNDISDISSLRKNPPWVTLAGTFKELITKICPGKNIEMSENKFNQYKEAIQMKFEGGYDESINAYLSNNISTTSGISPNMQGALTNERRLATELNLQAQGQSTRLQYDVESKALALLQVIKNIADLNANNLDGDYTFMTYANGQRTKATITKDIMLGDYNYKYNDRSAIMRKYQEFDKLKQLHTEFAQNPIMAERIDWEKLYIKAMQIFGEDGKEFLKPEEQMPQQGMPQGGAIPQMPGQGVGENIFNPEMAGVA